MASRYDLVGYDAEEERLKDPKGPSTANLMAAGSYIARVLDLNGVDWAIMGGFAMLCRGSPRPTRDIDIVTATAMDKLWKIIELQTRLIIPNTRLNDDVVKVFVKIGPAYRDSGCEFDMNIEVCLFTLGTKGTPLNLLDHRVLIEISIANRTTQLFGLDLLYMMKTKLRNCSTRTLQRDFEDVIFMLDTYPSELKDIRSQLDKDDLEFFLNIEFVTNQPGIQVDRFRAILGCENNAKDNS